MKTKIGMLIAIVLLLVWAIGASVAFVKESDRSIDLIFENSQLEIRCDKLSETNDELRTEIEEMSECEGDCLTALAFEIYTDMLMQTYVYKTDFDIEKKIDEVATREGMDDYEKQALQRVLYGIFVLYGVVE